MTSWVLAVVQRRILVVVPQHSLGYYNNRKKHILLLITHIIRGMLLNLKLEFSLLICCFSAAALENDDPVIERRAPGKIGMPGFGNIFDDAPVGGRPMLAFRG